MTLPRRPLLTAAIWIGALFVIFFLLPAPRAEAQVGIETVCDGTSAPPNFTLTDNCVTTETLTVDDGGTVNGGGFTITANDPGTPFLGAVLLNEGTTMNVTNLTVQGGTFASGACHAGVQALAGIKFLGASGTVSNVVVAGITQSDGCQEGHGIWVRADTALPTPPTVTITGTTVTDFQKTGLLAGGSTSEPVFTHVTGSTIGPADSTLTSNIAQNAVQIGSGPAVPSNFDPQAFTSTFTGNTVVGRGCGAAIPPCAVSTAMLIFRAVDLSITNNTITGAGTDTGIALFNGNPPLTNVLIENNAINRTAPGVPEISGFGVSSLSGAEATLVCNTFSGWLSNLNEITQPPCITTTALPNGTVGTAYSVPLAGHSPTPPIAWSVTGGSLPPGLTMAANGTISGAPTTAGTFTFTVTATDAVPLTATKDFTITISAAAPGPGPGPSGGGDLLGLVDPQSGLWSLRAANGAVTSFFYGNPGDVPMAGDWDCDGVDTPGLYRQSDGFVYLRNSNTQGIADIRFFFGNPGDIPLAGDFNADGCDSVSIYRPSEAKIYVINQLGANNGGLGPADFSYIFGNPADKPFVGDFNGDGTDTVGLHRETTGIVYFRQSNTTGVADAEFFFGDPGDRFVSGDWGVIDEVDTPGVFRPANSTFYLRYTNTQGIAEETVVLGDSTHLPVAGKWTP